MQSLADLPILFTDDYSEVNQAYLRDVYEEFSSRLFDFSRLYAPWYTKLFVDAVKDLENPAFILLLSDERDSLWPAQFIISRPVGAPSGRKAYWIAVAHVEQTDGDCDEAFELGRSNWARTRTTGGLEGLPVDVPERLPSRPPLREEALKVGVSLILNAFAPDDPGAYR